MKNGNAALKVIDNETEAEQKLTAANERIRALIAERENVQRELHKIEQAARPIEQAAEEAATLKQRKRGIIARMLRLGSVDPAADEVRAIDRQIADGARAATAAADVSDARREVTAELNQSLANIAMEFQSAHRDLRIAQHEVAGEEIISVLCPKVRDAMNAFGAALADLQGAGKAHVAMAVELREKLGHNAAQIGSEYPLRNLKLTIPGFGFDDAGGINLLSVDFGAQIEVAQAQYSARWRAGQTK